MKELNYTKHKIAYHNYTILETYEAGMKLIGAQVKSIREGNMQLKGSYVLIKDGILTLTSAHISKPSHVSAFDVFCETQDIVLLMKKKEILKLYHKVQEKGLTLVALEIYQPQSSNKIKVKIGLGRGNKDPDKRNILKQKQAIMDSKRELKEY